MVLSADTGKRELSNVKMHINSTVTLDEYARRWFVNTIYRMCVTAQYNIFV